MRRAAILAFVLVGFVGFAGLGASCTKQSADKSVDPGPGKPGGTGETIAVPGGSKTITGGGPDLGGAPEGDRGPDTSFAVKVDPPAPSSAGAEAVARVVVTPGPGWKMNHEYPTELSLSPPDGVKVQKALLELGDVAKLEDNELAFDVKLTSTKPGTYKVGGQLKFAVCTPETCDPKKQTIAFDLVAK
jgi:hypothetical protein